MVHKMSKHDRKCEIQTALLYCKQNRNEKHHRNQKWNEKPSGFGATTASNFRGIAACLLFITLFVFFLPVSLHVICRQFIGEFILVDILVLWDVSVGAVVPRAARGPPEEALLLVNAKTKKGDSVF